VHRDLHAAPKIDTAVTEGSGRSASATGRASAVPEIAVLRYGDGRIAAPKDCGAAVPAAKQRTTSRRSSVRPPSGASTAASQDRVLVREDGTALHYVVVGDGPHDVLLAHGLTSTGRLEWRYLLPLLYPGRRCLVPDLRGHGRSDHHEQEHGWDVVGDDLRALLQQEDSLRPHLVGFSFGSEVLLRMAVRDPGLAASLTLIGTSTGRPTSMPDTPMPAPGELSWPRALREAHLDKHGPHHWEHLVRRMSGLWRQVPELTVEALAQLGCPTLVVVGEHELDFKRVQARQLVDVVPGARLLDVAGAGHEAHIVERDLVGQAVVAHLRAAEAALSDLSGP
jgi:3-oxoadipate enol-lactonase